MEADQRKSERTPGPGPGGARFDTFRAIILDGSVSARSRLVERLSTEGFVDRAEFGSWLRTLLSEDLAPSPMRTSAEWIRDPKDIPTIRSWALSALVWGDPESPDSRAMLLQYLDPDFEPDAGSRFWVLGGLLQRRVDYVGAALERSSNDPDRAVALLARIAADPDDPGLRELTADLESDDFRQAWPVLRVLRVIPVTSLAGAVARLLERGEEDEFWRYDALYALASPPMAEAVREQLLQSPGLERLAEIVLEESRRSNEVAAENFARLLSVFDREVATAAVRAAAAKLGVGPAATSRIFAAISTADEASDGNAYSAGFNSDTTRDLAHDDIGIRREVQTLAAVMLDTDTEPPLAIGLFGAWGSGKSFFMQSLQKEVTRLADLARQTGSARFKGYVVPIEFNAWHYSDANLWASLVSHILEQLANYHDPAVEPAEQESAVQHQLESTRADIAFAEEEKTRAAGSVDDAQKKLAELRVKRESGQIKLRDLRARDFANILESDPALQDTLSGALAAVGAPAVVNSAADLNRVIEESYSTAGRTAALIAGIFKGNSWKTVLVCILAVLAAAPVVGALVELAGSGRLAFISAISAQVVAILASATAVLRNGLRQARGSFEALAAAKAQVDKVLKDKRAEPTPEETKLLGQIATAAAEEQQARERLAHANARAMELEARLVALHESRTIGHFLAERTRSDDYRRHLGLVSTVRRDFEALVNALHSKEAQSSKRIDRIVLYIDDLDRCPAAMVVEVLQAVHLLLAYSLFVVVVSVDPRWLLKSLQKKYDQLDAGSGGDASWTASPQDYLEKIFQIPFSVRPMDSNAYARLVNRLLGGEEAEPDEPMHESNENEKGSRLPDQASPPPSKPAGDGNEPEAGPQHAPSTTEERKATPSGSIGAEAAVSLEALGEALTIHSAEREFAMQLGSFITTPRAAKRFANTYRILKASLPRKALSRHEGTSELPGEFRLAMLLLALLVGNPNEATTLFPQFLSNAREGRREFWVSRSEIAESELRADLREAVRAIASVEGFPNSPNLLREWLPRVARFSFSTAAVAARRGGG